MVMSQGTSTFLACFAGFWLVWALVVMLCCFCSVLQRRLKRRGDARLRERCLRTVETETPGCAAVPAFAQASPAPVPMPMTIAPAPPAPAPPQQQQMPRDPPPVPLQVSHPLPEANWVSVPEADLLENPPCYEEAVLMEDPPPPYADVLVEPRVGGGYLKHAAHRAAPPLRRDQRDPSPETRKPPPPQSSSSCVFPERGYSSLIRLPSSQRWDSLGHLLSNVDLKPFNPYEPVPPGVATATMPRRDIRTGRDGSRAQGLHVGFSGGIRGGHGTRGLERSCGLPAAFSLLGRSTAV